MKFETIAIKTEYLHPNSGYDLLIDYITNYCEDNDIIVISETPISTIEGNLVDESLYLPSFKSKLLTYFSKYFWGYFLSPIIRDKKRTIDNLRKMPREAINHKEFILREFGLKYALEPTGEAGVDLSNVPEQYVSLLPENPKKSAYTIKDLIKDKSSKCVDVVIIDTDGCYELFGIKYTTLPKSAPCIRNDTGVYGYLLKSISKKLGPTILASTINKNLNFLIDIANIAEDIQIKNSDNFFETIYDMKDMYESEFSNINNEMLNENIHIPAVIIRMKK